MEYEICHGINANIKTKSYLEPSYNQQIELVDYVNVFNKVNMNYKYIE